jgi:adenylosuccinate synthase
MGVILKNLAVAGAQWGDEGKGKVVDLLANRFDGVIRYQGGPNAGHSVVFGGQRFALHVLPSGIFHKDVINVIANGVVINPAGLVEEIRGLTTRGIEITADQLKISDRAHAILPFHRILDHYGESSAAENKKIGTTGRGIGPAYEWKVGRRGVRFCDLISDDRMRARLEEEVAFIKGRYPYVEDFKTLTAEDVFNEIKPSVDALRPFVCDSVTLIAEMRKTGKSLLFEGAQATLLDIDFGTYPYVTSSNSCTLGIPAGSGVPLNTVQASVGICKAYCTRVGHGPFPTELEDETGEALRKAGHEFGTTTGRPRRCGWLDLVALRYVQMLNGFDTLAIMKLDVMDGLDTVKLCVGYDLDGERIETLPAHPDDLSRVTPIYHEMPGWQTSLENVRNWDDLPEAARAYLEYVETFTGCSVGLVSVGPDREQTILRSGLFAQ